MMNRIPIGITDRGLFNFDLRHIIIINKRDYAHFVCTAKRLDLCDEIMENISMECAICHSFIVDLFVLCGVIDEVPGFPDCEAIFRNIEIKDEFWDAEFQEAAIIFDRDCSCNKTFVGKLREQEIEDFQIFESSKFNVRNGSYNVKRRDLE